MNPLVESKLPVAVLAPPRDAQLTARVLGQAGIATVTCASGEALLELVRAGDVAAAVIAEEALEVSLFERIEVLVASQPTWSDFPFVVVAAASHKESLLPSLRRLGNVAVLTRPMSPDALASMVAAELRARDRQLQVKRLLDEQQDQVRRKDELLMMLAHELRNPLAPVRYAAEVLREGKADPAQRESAIEVIGRQVGHMGEIIERMLEVFRATRGMERLQLQTVRLGDLARASIEAHAMQRGRDIRVEEIAEAWVRGDPGRLRQVIDNLVDNAVKFSPVGSEVVVRVGREGDQATLEVVDRGDGLDAALLAHVFEPFTQATQSLARTGGGLGLGLALVRALVQLHGGEVSARSDGKGQGAVFRVTLPCVEAPAGIAAPSHEPSNDAGFIPRRVLIAEDNQDAAEVLQMLLELHGHEVEVVHDGRSAVEAARGNPPDVVLCDIGLPEMTGYEVAGVLRRASPRPRLVAVTGYGTPEDRERALRAGFDTHLPKPVDPTALIAEVERAARMSA